jgi:predicted nucleic acid-binding protein
MYKGNEVIIQRIKVIGQHNIAISDVTSAELLFGARNKDELKILKKDIEKLTSISISSSISKLAVNLVEKYSLSHKLSLPDALIAASAIQNEIQLFTLNIKDFKFIRGLKLFS